MKYLVLILKGMAYGVTHIVPGVGGGLILILLGIYEQFVSTLGNLLIERRKWRQHLQFLIPLGIGMVLGMVILAKLITFIMGLYPATTMFFFMGLLLGTVPMVLKLHGDMRPTVGRVIALLLGLGLVVVTRMLKPAEAGSGSIAALSSGSGILYNAVISFFAGGASVTPGLDGSYVLLLGGTYDALIEGISALTNLTIHWSLLIPFGIAALAGILIFSKLIDIAIKRVPAPSYYVILGLILGSVYGLWPRESLAGSNWLVLVLALVVGCALAWYLGRKDAEMVPASSE